MGRLITHGSSECTRLPWALISHYALFAFMATLVSPAMGHWGTSPLDLQQLILFSVL